MKNAQQAQAKRSAIKQTPRNERLRPRGVANIGLIGLAAMGSNLARNLANKGFNVCVFNRTTEKTLAFIKEFGTEKFSYAKTLKEFVQKLEKPRKIILLVKAGEGVEEMIKSLTPLLDKNDILLDLGNSNYKETQKHFATLEKKGLHFIGCGISGGEEGALLGPSLMPGGTLQSYKKIEPIFSRIAAKDFSGKPCITFIGQDGAGHYVKMVHNGIEYAMMQLIAESYDLLKNIYNLSPPELSKIYTKYNQGPLKSYLIEITAKIFTQKDSSKKSDYLIDKILDKAGQKGTGKWTALDALEHDCALPTITDSVFARITSSEKSVRTTLSKSYKTTSEISKKLPLKTLTEILENALYLSILSAYCQGFELIKKTAEENNWKINLSEISRIWEGGCIIRADILNFLHKAFKKENKKHFLAIKEVQKKVTQNLPRLRELTAYGTLNGMNLPAHASALYYLQAMTTAQSPANLIQAQRDFFGAHTYERTDKKGIFHTEWQARSEA